MEDFSLKRQTYDIAFKLSIANEYEASTETCATPAHKYKVPRTTITSWIKKRKILETNQKGSANAICFLNITPKIKGRESIDSTEEIALTINGFEIKQILATSRNSIWIEACLKSMMRNKSFRSLLCC